MNSTLGSRIPGLVRSFSLLPQATKDTSPRKFSLRRSARRASDDITSARFFERGVSVAPKKGKEFDYDNATDYVELSKIDLWEFWEKTYVRGLFEKDYLGEKKPLGVAISKDIGIYDRFLAHIPTMEQPIIWDPWCIQCNDATRYF